MKTTEATPILVFSHANGFPAGCYEDCFAHWRAQGWQVYAVPKFGHDPAYPVTNNWPHLREQLLAYIGQVAPGRGKLFLVGHSMGGYLSLMAASRLPHRVAGVVLVDAPVVAGWRAHSLHVGKLTGLAERLSPGHISKKRRWQWPSAQAAFDHFAAKRSFQRWAPGVLERYIACGTEADAQAAAATGNPQAVRLAFKRDVETRIYNTLPHHIETVLKRHALGGPVAFVGGTQSTEVRQAGLAFTKRLCGQRFQWLEAGHLLPMEQPQATAEAVLSALAGMR